MDQHDTNPDQESASNPNAPSWATIHLWHMQPVRDVLLGLGVFALIVIGQKASVVTVPLLLAILLAYLFEPVICWVMNRFGFSRRTSVISIIAGVVLLVVIPSFIGASFAVGQLVTFTTNTVEHFAEINEAREMPAIEATEYFTEKETPAPWVWIHDEIRGAKDEDSAVGDVFTTITNWVTDNSEQVAQTMAQVGINAFNSVLSMIGAVFGLSFTLFVTAFFFFFTATEWVGLQQFGTNLLPDKNRDRIIDLVQKFDLVIAGFIRGRLTIAFLQAIVFSIGYFIIGVPGAFILGPVVALLSIVPYLALVGLPISITLLALQGHAGFRGEWWWVFGAPTLFYFMGQALDDYIWTPLIQGKSTGMDTPTILFASLAGGALFGVFGLLIAIPIAACIKILIQEVFWPRFKDWAEGRSADPLPIDH
jgi:predicted PurR-regulated permease PerM